ncbi:GDP-mannose mannosyl hydrolase [Halorubrum ezzemoulense]|uniref:NUDIX domain-containing protein n=1 Tax=Halorubrum ezzemoulense TaxID=337243 RepID=A0A481RCJ1_HALEZ|nr:NUDIX domain-containing protein [Halorubrum ezzemoulense]QAY18878.1 NUDIX domain-containing protein [Halorubrum ezzemoulense]
MSEWIPEEEWETIVRNVPIVSVDLVVKSSDGIVLGKRTNKPAKGEWFVPGERVQKGETRVEAVHRIAQEELGVSVDVTESLGAFEHRYETSDAEGVETKHYLANGYAVELDSGQIHPDDQHGEVRVFGSAPDSLHPFIRSYFEASETIVGWV